MADPSISSTQTAPPVEQPPFEQVRRGYRWRSILLPDGREVSVQVPLTPEDFLDPQEGDPESKPVPDQNLPRTRSGVRDSELAPDPIRGQALVPESTFHATATTDLHSRLTLRYAADPTVAVFHDMIVRWGIPGLSNPAPDIAVGYDFRFGHLRCVYPQVLDCHFDHREKS